MNFDHCKHFWRIIKEIPLREKGWFGGTKEYTIYHLQCKRCGDIKQGFVEGIKNEKTK